MNSQQESRMSRLRRGYWQELETGDSSMFLFVPMEKVIKAKTIDEKITALESLLTSMVRGQQGTADYWYDKENY
jgi:hypothetical protein